MSYIDLSKPAPLYQESHGKFVVKNIMTTNAKTIRIFDYPIPVNSTRNLLAIPNCNEALIRESLLKGTLRLKILAGEIEVVESDIDLLQFNLVHRSFLESAGINNGVEVIGTSPYTKREDIPLIGDVNDVNTIFTIPDDHFIYEGEYKILVYLNGVRQIMSDDYIIAESGGPGSGYDRIIFTVPPATGPESIPDVLRADYYIENP